MSFPRRLASIPRAKAISILEEKAFQLKRNYRFYPNEVQPALKFVLRLLEEGKRTGLVAWPMQSGKTSIIACVFRLLRELLPELRGVFICANDQTDLRRQNRERLEHLPGFEVLSRIERKTWERYSRELLIVFYDENHFGDGIDMTINEFLDRHDIKDSDKIVFCGVSATPFSAFSCLDFEIWPDMRKLEDAGYNSPGMMLRRNRIRESDCLFIRQGTRTVTINTSANVYRHIEEVMAQEIPEGYCMIRARFEEAQALESHLKEKFGDRAFVKHWNMRAKDFSPESYFDGPRPGVFTFVLVQHKARMGNTINTEHFEFFYEHSPSACLDTILQSFVGRACGFGKQEHRAIVYSNRAMAEAYDILINSQGKESELKRFRNYCLLNGIKPATRATLGARQAEFEVEEIAKKNFHGRSSLEKTIRPWILSVKESHGLGSGAIRTLSKTAIPERKRGRRVLHPESGDNSFFCGTTPGDWGAFIYDDYHEGSELKKDWKGIVVKVTRRTSKRNELWRPLGPTEKSLHTTF